MTDPNTRTAADVVSDLVTMALHLHLRPRALRGVMLEAAALLTSMESTQDGDARVLQQISKLQERPEDAMQAAEHGEFCECDVCLPEYADKVICRHCKQPYMGPEACPGRDDPGGVCQRLDDSIDKNLVKS